MAAFRTGPDAGAERGASGAGGTAAGRGAHRVWWSQQCLVSESPFPSVSSPAGFLPPGTFAKTEA